MKTCAYCGEAGPFSREHVIPKWLYQRTTEYEFQTLYAQPNKMLNTELTIRDVCARCNNNALASLDIYGLELYEQYLHHFVQHDETIHFLYDFDRLARWLLKMSYNSARVHGSDSEELSNQTQYILAESDRPPNLAVYLLLVIPYRVRPEQKLYPSLEGVDSLPPASVRISRADHPAYAERFRVCRMIGINSYYLYVLLPRDKHVSPRDWNVALHEFQEACPGAKRVLPTTSEVIVPASETDTFDVTERYLLDHLHFLNAWFDQPLE